MSARSVLLSFSGSTAAAHQHPEAWGSQAKPSLCLRPGRLHKLYQQLGSLFPSPPVLGWKLSRRVQSSINCACEGRWIKDGALKPKSRRSSSFTCMRHQLHPGRLCSLGSQRRNGLVSSGSEPDLPQVGALSKLMLFRT